MSDEPFAIDSNILIHAIDGRDPLKQALARQIVTSASVLDCRLPNHAIAEFFAIATYKLKLDHSVALEAAKNWMRLFAGIPTSRAAIEAAMKVRGEGRFAFWDAVLMATAEEGGCRVFVSEDMHDGARLGSIVVRAPYIDGSLAAPVRELLGL